MIQHSRQLIGVLELIAYKNVSEQGMAYFIKCAVTGDELISSAEIAFGVIGDRLLVVG